MHHDKESFPTFFPASINGTNTREVFFIMGKIRDITGMKFNKLTALCIVGKYSDGSSLWKCECQCGGEAITIAGRLIKGLKRDCGCDRFERRSNISKTHGLSKTRFYKAWVGMKERCYKPNHISHKNYYDKGIKVCDRWLESFENFLADMKEGYTDELTLDRIDNSKGYNKDNCRWATYIEQTNNVSTNRIIDIDGIKDTLANTCRRYNIGYDIVLCRLVLGWEIDRAFKTPKLNSLDNLTYNNHRGAS
jgi:hypothetical protein